MKLRNIAIISCIFALMATATYAYQGQLSTDDGGLVGTGPWSQGSTFQWVVTQNSDGSWHYQYQLTVPGRDVSHICIEASDSFSLEDLFNPSAESGTYGAIEVGTRDSGDRGYPGLPDVLHGITFDSTTGTDLVVSFDSWRQPVWGDFYAKDGVFQGEPVTIWNSGFTSSDWDPTVAPHDGSEGFHILRPDTSVVPEPSSLLVLAAGLGGLGTVIRRRTSQK